MKIGNTAPGNFTAPNEVRLVRCLPGPIERVWDYLLDPEKRAQWFAGGPIEPRAGGKVALVVRHQNLSPGETAPGGYECHHDVGFVMEWRVTRYEPPGLLAFTFHHTQDDSETIFELTPEGDCVQLVLTHRCRGDQLPHLVNFAAGWHSHLIILLFLLENTERPLFWADHNRLVAHNQKTSAPLHAP